MTNFDLIQIMPRDELVDFLVTFVKRCNAADSKLCVGVRVIPEKVSMWLAQDVRGEPEGWESESIEILNLKPRIYEALFTAGVRTLGDIIRLRAYDMRKIPHIGESGLEEIITSVKVHTNLKIPD